MAKMSKLSKLPTILSSRNLLMMSLALNVSLMLKMLCQVEESKNLSCSEKTMVPADAESNRGAHIINQSRLAVSPIKSFKNSTRTDEHPGARDRIINLDHGDPTMYESFWRRMGHKTTIIIPGWQSLSYFSDVTNICWFLEPEFANQVTRLHNVVGNAVTEGRHIVVGTGSSQLILAALYALSLPHADEPVSVVSAVPYYSSYPSMADYQKSGLYKWAGDAASFHKDGPFIELVTSPNNPDGSARQSVVNRSLGLLIHDLAYYWPQYTPIPSPSDYDLTLFTVSKSTGHAGMRIGWALVKDPEVAKKMTKFIELSTIGVSKDSQLRAAKVLKTVSDSCEQENTKEGESFFKYSYNIMAERWKLLRAAVDGGGLFSLPKFSSGFCTFFGQESDIHPAFAWLKCEGDVEDCANFLKGHKILTRSGRQFGASPKYVRISMLDTDENFIQLIDRLSAMHI